MNFIQMYFRHKRKTEYYRVRQEQVVKVHAVDYIQVILIRVTSCD